jgi:hypothetical protein
MFIQREMNSEQGQPDEVGGEAAQRGKAMTSHPLPGSSEIGSYDDLGRAIANLLRAAQNEAAKVVVAAEAEAQAIRANAQKENRELIDASRAVEAWLSGTVGTFRDVVAKLEKVLEAPPAELEEALLQEAQAVAADLNGTRTAHV